jgi:hypothetical protein
MAGLLEQHWVWAGFGWLCLLAFSLWFIALLFPLPGGSNKQEAKDRTLINAQQEDSST